MAKGDSTIDIEKAISLSELDKAYIAGFFDGEGHVVISPRKTGNAVVQVGAAQNRPAVLYWISSYFTGKVYQDKNGTYKWAIGGSVAVKCFLRLIRPYMRIKAQEADEALTMMDSGRNYSVEEIDAARERMRSYRKPTLVVNNAKIA